MSGITPEPWMADSACTQYAPDTWFGGVEAEKEAVTICGGCSVSTACLAYAIRTEQDWGIWGGLTAYERSQIRKAA